MNNKEWNKKIKNNFDNAANNYLNYSNIQLFFAKKIVSYIKELNMQNGPWIDLGSGTGLLADEIEKEFSAKKVSRIDFSKNMLLQNKSSRKIILWDLNNKLPETVNNSALMASNFCLHWLNNPEKIIKNWFSKLKSGGYLIISYPTKECFPEWKKTCRKTNIEYSGLSFLNPDKLSKSFESKEIHFSKKFSYKENFPNIYELFRSIVNVGAHSSRYKRKTVKEFKSMQRFWPKNYDNTVNLSWEIHILIIKKS